MLCAGTSLAMVSAFVAALRAGLVVVPVNPSYTRGEVERIVAAARPVAAIVEHRERAGWIRAAANDAIVLGLDGLERRGDGPASIDAVGLEDPALMLYTSGTTGAPKGALLSHRNLLASARSVELAWRWTGDDSLLLALPLFHIHGLGVGLNGSLVRRRTVVLRAALRRRRCRRATARRGTTLFFGVPAMYQRLLDAGRAQALAPLRLIVSGSAPLSAALAMRSAAATGQRPLERYGMTETVMITSNPYDGPRKPGTVGPAAARGRAAPGGATGRGPGARAERARRLLTRPDANAEAFTDDGWFRTGDLGEFDDDGYLRLVGRSKELIISGGYNVYPREVEEALATHPGVREVAVVGRPTRVGRGRHGGRRRRRRGSVEAALRAYAAERLAPTRCPRLSSSSTSCRGMRSARSSGASSKPEPVAMISIGSFEFRPRARLVETDS